uniref:DUF753 domain-containing protein n=1 Tax=Macrostomum lignano TaxID=282301 RepID=A0A1I8GG40_9PLAT
MAEALKEKKAVACKTCSTAKCNTEVLLTVEAPTPKTECQPSAAVDPKIPAKCVYFQNEHSDEKTIIATCGDCVSFSKYADKALISTTCQSCTADTCAAEPSMAKVEPAAKGLKCFVSFDQKSKVKTLAMCKAGVRQCHRAESKSGRAVFIAACGNCEPFNSHIKGAAEGVTCKACGTERCNSAQPPEKAAQTSVMRARLQVPSAPAIFEGRCGDCAAINAMGKITGVKVECHSCKTDLCNSVEEFKRISSAKSDEQSSASSVQYGNIEAIGINVFLTVFAYA